MIGNIIGGALFVVLVAYWMRNEIRMHRWAKHRKRRLEKAINDLDRMGK